MDKFKKICIVAVKFLELYVIINFAVIFYLIATTNYIPRKEVISVAILIVAIELFIDFRKFIRNSIDK